jgi:hypothetical protein
VIYSVAPAAPEARFRYRDGQPLKQQAYYYLRVIQEDGNMAWSSPIWVAP